MLMGSTLRACQTFAWHCFASCILMLLLRYIYLLQMSRSIVLTAMVWSESPNNAVGSIALNWYSGFPLTYTCAGAQHPQTVGEILHHCQPHSG